MSRPSFAHTASTGMKLTGPIAETENIELVSEREKRCFLYVTDSNTISEVSAEIHERGINANVTRYGPESWAVKCSFGDVDDRDDFYEALNLC